MRKKFGSENRKKRSDGNSKTSVEQWTYQKKKVLSSGEIKETSRKLPT